MFTFTPLSAEVGQLQDISVCYIIILLMAALLRSTKSCICFGGGGVEHLFIENTASFEHVGGRRRQKKGRRGRNGAAEPQGQS